MILDRRSSNSAPLARPIVSMTPLPTARMQAWNQRIAPLLSNLRPVASKIALRTEFTGAGTAEHAMLAAAQVFNGSSTGKERIEIKVESVGDWSTASMNTVSQNHPESCRFRDIMGLAPTTLKQKLQEPLKEKAGWVGTVFCSRQKQTVLLLNYFISYRWLLFSGKKS